MRGIAAAGGLPVAFPVMSLSEDLMKPTAMLYRNLLAIEVEETIRSQPLDGVVALGNCDKTVPAALMALARIDKPAVVLYGGPMRAGRFGGREVSIQDMWEAVGAVERGAGRDMDHGAVVDERRFRGPPRQVAFDQVDSRVVERGRLGGGPRRRSVRRDHRAISVARAASEPTTDAGPCTAVR